MIAWLRNIPLCSGVLLAFAICPCLAQQAEPGNTTDIRVPFVGCESDGQAGRLEAPMQSEKIVQVDRRFADKLAYYKPTNSSGVLAPRGWFCFGTYGSGGDATFVTAAPIDSTRFFSEEWQSFTGPEIEVDHRYGGTSGRTSVASMVARVFPKYKAFVDKVVEMFDFLAPEMVFGPYSADRLVYRGDRIVEYRTPARSEGLGTAISRFKPSDQPIEGVATLLGQMPEIDLLLLSARLPAELAALKTPIIQQLEREVAAGEPPNLPR
jgi:hypothetical protein